MSEYCFSSLAPVKEPGFSPAARRRLAGGDRKIPFRLPFSREDIIQTEIAQAEHMSISGVQDKVSLKLVKGALTPVDAGGEFILKPVPSAVIPAFQKDVPANEHVTMQIAEQVYGIRTAVNAVVVLRDGEMAYLTRRFDREKSGGKFLQEDFCQISGRSPETHGKQYKYDGSYEELGRILKRVCPAYRVEAEKLFQIILFNYVFSNGDAHLKNFSLYRGPQGDHILTPAYDLLCTSLHSPEESRTALDLFDSFESDYFRQNGFYGYEDFFKLAELFEIRTPRTERLIQHYSQSAGQVESMVKRSFLSEPAKAEYLARFRDRMKTLSSPDYGHSFCSPVLQQR